MQQNISNPDQRFCYKCHHPAGIADAVCARCGSRALKTKKTIRTLGGVIVFLGCFISAMMAGVLVLMFGIFAKADASKFKGEESTMIFAVGIVGLTLLVGISFTITGILQIIFGKRNTIVAYISLFLVGVLVVAGWIFTALH
jgi:ribosomal protein L40E